VGGSGDLRIRIRREATQVRLKARGSDVSGDEQDDQQALAPSNGLGHEGLGQLASNERNDRDCTGNFVDFCGE